MSHRSTGAQARIAELCRVPLESRQLRAAVLDQIRRWVPFDSYAWLLTDPQTRVGWSPLAEVPELARLPMLIRLKYATAVNRWTSLAADRCVSLASVTGGDLSRSRLWRELLSGYGVTDVASMAFSDQYGCWRFLDLWRHGGSGVFGDGEQDLLTGVVPQLTSALRAGQAVTFDGPPTPTTEQGPSVVLLSPDLAIVGQTAQSDAHLRQLLPTATGASPVPAAAYNVAAQLLAVEDGIDDGPAQVRSQLTGTRWLTLRAARLAGDGQQDNHLIAVTVEQIAPRDRVELYARAHGLSPRERELLHRLTHGSSTRQLASQMSLSEHTVPDHLKSIFSKTDTKTRSTVVARSLGSEDFS